MIVNRIAGSFPCVALLVAIALPANAQPWTEQGPGPITGGQAEGISGNPVSGAISAIVTVPGDSNTVYVSAVNGGIWKTSNALAASPTWVPLTDQLLPSLSINALAISPLSNSVLYGGSGSTSSFGFLGSSGYGVVKSTDGGATWSVLAGATFTGRRISSVVPTAATTGSGQVVLVSTLFDKGGLYRSVDGGNTFTRLSGDGVSGLPDAGVSNIAADPGVSTRFYAGVPANFVTSGTPGVYKSEDSGATWAPVNNATLNVANSDRILLAVHHNISDVVYAMVIVASGGNDVLGGVFRSGNQGGVWTTLDTPSPNIYPGGQGILHGAIAAHPTNNAVVFISGDRQDSPFPNSNGCNDFSGAVFRGDASQVPGSQMAVVVCNGANGTSPHADSRALVFDSQGNLLHGTDGGLYKLTSPDSSTRTWVSFQGNVRPNELHSGFFDQFSHIIFGGAQDTGTPMQNSPGNQTWNDFITGDGGVVAVDPDQTAHPGNSLRYTSFDFLASFNRSMWDSANNFLGFNFVGLNITSGSGTGLTLFQFDPNIQFYNPYVLNNLNTSHMLIGTGNIYESLDKGDHLANLGFTGHFISSLSYGSRLSGTPFPDAFYVGGDTVILHRVLSGGPITTLSAYPGGNVRSLVMDPQNYKNVYVADQQGRVWASTDEGATWTNLTANLATFTTNLNAIEIFSPSASPINTVLLVAGQNGVFQMRRPGAAGTVWAPLGTGLPHALFFDLHYNYACDVLLASSLGRGAWTISGVFRGASTAACPAGGFGGASVGAASAGIPAPPPRAQKP